MKSIYDDKILELIRQRDELLKQRPELQALQDEVDRRLAKAGNQNNRMVIIGQMMWDSFHQLNQALQDFTKGKNSEETKKKTKLTLVNPTDEGNK